MVSKTFYSLLSFSFLTLLFNFALFSDVFAFEDGGDTVQVILSNYPDQVSQGDLFTCDITILNPC